MKRKQERGLSINRWGESNIHPRVSRFDEGFMELCEVGSSERQMMRIL